MKYGGTSLGFFFLDIEVRNGIDNLFVNAYRFSGDRENS
jgi:hypothetical protein